MKFSSHFIFVSLILWLSIGHLFFGQNNHQFFQSSSQSSNNKQKQQKWDSLRLFFVNLNKDPYFRDVFPRVIAISKGTQTNSKTTKKYSIASLIFESSIVSISDLNFWSKRELDKLFDDGITRSNLDNALTTAKKSIESQFQAYQRVFKRHRNLLFQNFSFFHIDNFTFWSPIWSKWERDERRWSSPYDPYNLDLKQEKITIQENDIDQPFSDGSLSKNPTKIAQFAFSLFLGGIKPARFDTFLQTELPDLIKFWEQIRSFLIKFAIDEIPSSITIPTAENSVFELSNFKDELSKKNINLKDVSPSTLTDLQSLIDHKIDFAKFKKSIQNLSLPQVSSAEKTTKNQNLTIGLGATAAIIVFSGGVATFTWWFMKNRKS